MHSIYDFLSLLCLDMVGTQHHMLVLWIWTGDFRSVARIGNTCRAYMHATQLYCALCMQNKVCKQRRIVKPIWCKTFTNFVYHNAICFEHKMFVINTAVPSWYDQHLGNTDDITKTAFYHIHDRSCGCDVCSEGRVSLRIFW